MEGFEPPVQLPIHRISSAAHSTTLAHFRGKDRNYWSVGKFSLKSAKIAQFQPKQGQNAAFQSNLFIDTQANAAIQATVDKAFLQARLESWILALAPPGQSILQGL
jgi:hypothetical protein